MQAQNPAQDLIALCQQVQVFEKNLLENVQMVIKAKQDALVKVETVKNAAEAFQSAASEIPVNYAQAKQLTHVFLSVEEWIRKLPFDEEFIKAELSFLGILEAMEQYKQKLKSPIAQLTGAPGTSSPGLDAEQYFINAVKKRMSDMNIANISDDKKAAFKMMKDAGRNMVAEQLKHELLIKRLSQPMREIQLQAIEIEIEQRVQGLWDESWGKDESGAKLTGLKTVETSTATARLEKMQEALISLNKAEADLKQKTPKTSDPTVNAVLEETSAGILNDIKGLQANVAGRIQATRDYIEIKSTIMARSNDAIQRTTYGVIQREISESSVTSAPVFWKPQRPAGGPSQSHTEHPDKQAQLPKSPRK